MRIPKAVLILVLAGIILYFPTLFNGFVWDDEELILNNTQVHSLANWPAFLSGSTFNSGGGGNLAGLYYKPLMTMAFSLLYTLFGPSAWAFHAFQIGIHIANAVLLFYLLRRLFSPYRVPGVLPEILAMLFLIHPINTEATVYIADYQDVLFFFFGILAFLSVLKTGDRQLKTAPAKPVLVWSGLILLSLLSKETGVVFTAVIFVYIFLFSREKLRYFVPAGILAAGVYAVLRFGVAHIFFNKHGLTPITTMPLSDRLINIPAIIWFYLKTFFWPQNLAINQQWVVRSIDPITVLADLGILGGLGGLGVLVYKKKREIFPLWVFFLIWFLLALTFHLQIFPLDLTVSDRWFYLPAVGLLGMLVLAGGLKKWGRREIFGFWIIVLILSGRTWMREFDWRDGLTLYRHDINLSPNAFDLENNYGVELFRHGDLADAKVHFIRSTELSPQWWTNWNNLGVIYEREGNPAEAAEDYRKAIDNGNYYLAYENYAAILLKTGKNAQAREFLEKEALPRLPFNVRLKELYALSLQLPR